MGKKKQVIHILNTDKMVDGTKSRLADDKKMTPEQFRSWYNTNRLERGEVLTVGKG